MDNIAVFFTSEGEALIYSGTDPSSTATWALLGVFQIGAPIGLRCMIKAGPDLILMIHFLPLSTMLSVGKAQYLATALSKRIEQEVNESSARFSGLFGWQAVLVPKTDDAAVQHSAKQSGLSPICLQHFDRCGHPIHRYQRGVFWLVGRKPVFRQRG